MAEFTSLCLVDLELTLLKFCFLFWVVELKSDTNEPGWLVGWVGWLRVIWVGGLTIERLVVALWVDCLIIDLLGFPWFGF